jgi:hypothetical protein
MTDMAGAWKGYRPQRTMKLRYCDALEKTFHKNSPSNFSSFLLSKWYQLTEIPIFYKEKKEDRVLEILIFKFKRQGDSHCPLQKGVHPWLKNISMIKS